MPSRSSRSRPASLISVKELTGSASLATAMPHRTVAALVRSKHGQGLRLAARGAAQDSRRLGFVLPRLRARAALLRGVRGGAADRLPGVRRRTALALSRMRRAVLLRIRGRVRSVRRRPQACGSLWRAYPQARPLGPGDLGEADERDDVLFRDVAVVEMAKEARHVLGPADLRVVVLDLPRRELHEPLHLDLVDDGVEDLLARPVALADEDLHDHSLLVLA